MRAKLREIVDDIGSAAGEIDANVTELDETAEVVNSMCTDNSATTQEMAASMQECANSADHMNTDIANIRNDSSICSENISESIREMYMHSYSASTETVR